MQLPDPAAVTVARGFAPFTLKPLVHDLLRTRYAVPGSIYLVEDVRIAPLPSNDRWQLIRLLLGDGEFCIQALLTEEMHRFVHTLEITVGCYVRLDDAELQWEKVDGEGGAGPQNMVYLVVKDLRTVGWNRSVQKLHEQQGQRPSPQQQDEAVNAEHEGPVLDKTRGKMPMNRTPSPPRAVKTPTKPQSLKRRRQDREDTSQDSKMDDAFQGLDALLFPPKKTQKSPLKPAPKPKPKEQPAQPVALPRDWHNPQTPLKLTTLRAIPSLPYQQNWSCNVLAIVASVSPVESSNLPPYRQRTARITDPSTAKQVHLTVFLDPDKFDPKVGSAVLLTGVKNHRFDGGSLKKYASDRGHGRWWFEDPWELTWCDVKGIKDWWAEMEVYFASQVSDEMTVL
ncbi:uncharacterized protein UV8b_05985 [Ustilaginoidea virens]|uniref:Uncharacterized protein n=1 Tax=Ustilaginoidea virens TaxID=1159556 RepID=A0A063BL88_USTVR|nr:uncharacterized protein UV8b_05985 [Ustilaginoidea virens]QUC21742.1 hypothetical protein UV8b_05985 [Ustilaginoidea virens]GAO17462.1 hypothetical protein UVI_02051990 [Ustilaginoidea virens]